MQFIQEILGVHIRTTNALCRAELVRLPLWTKINSSSIKFWKHIITSENTFVFNIYNTAVHANAWAKSMFSVINNLMFTFIIDKGSSIKHLLSIQLY